MAKDWQKDEMGKDSDLIAAGPLPSEFADAPIEAVRAPAEPEQHAPDHAKEDAEFAHAVAMLEAPGGDIGTEIKVPSRAVLDELPMHPVAIDGHGRVWAVDHENDVLRLVGRVVR